MSAGAFALPAPGGLRRAFRASGWAVAPAALSAPDVEPLRAEAHHLADVHGRDVEREGEDPLRYRVVPGEVVLATRGALKTFYESPELLVWVREVTGEPNVGRSRSIRSAVNVNAMSRAGDRYRWHHDAEPFSLLVFLNDLHAEDGGRFELRGPDGRTERVTPSAGTIVVFDGTIVRHRVAPLLRDTTRLTIPLVFPSRPDIARPPGLDGDLYDP